MRLTRQTNFAVRILMYCAANEGKLSRIGDIAEAYGMSELYLFKILQPLVEAGIVKSVRGRHGGICLAKPAHAISLLEIVQHCEENFTLAECFSEESIDCPLVDNCKLNRAFRRALDAFFAVLAEYSIQDLIGDNVTARLLGIEALAESQNAEILQ